MAVMIESLFAFLTSRGKGGRRVAEGSKGSKGGAFHYFFDLNPTFRSLFRCFVFAVPLVLVQLHTMWSLYTSFRRYVGVLHLNEQIVEFFRQSEEFVGGNEKFSRRQYVHPIVWDDGEAAVCQVIEAEVVTSPGLSELGTPSEPTKVPSFFENVNDKAKTPRSSRKFRLGLRSRGVNVTKKVVCSNSSLRSWRRDATRDGDSSPTLSLGSSASARSVISGVLVSLQRQHSLERRSKTFADAGEATNLLKPDPGAALSDGEEEAEEDPSWAERHPLPPLTSADKRPRGDLRRPIVTIVENKRPSGDSHRPDTPVEKPAHDRRSSDTHRPDTSVDKLVDERPKGDSNVPDTSVDKLVDVRPRGDPSVVVPDDGAATTPVESPSPPQLSADAGGRAPAVATPTANEAPPCAAAPRARARRNRRATKFAYSLDEHPDDL